MQANLVSQRCPLLIHYKKTNYLAVNSKLTLYYFPQLRFELR